MNLNLLIKKCELIDSDFSADNIVNNNKELISLINSGKLKRGSIILYDELRGAKESKQQKKYQKDKAKEGDE